MSRTKLLRIISVIPDIERLISFAPIITDNPGEGNSPFPGLILNDVVFLYFGATFSIYRFFAAINLPFTRLILL